MRLFLSILGATVLAGALAAQPRPVRTLSGDGASQALRAAEAEAVKVGWLVSIAVVDPAGDLLAFYRMDGAMPASIQNALGKARTAARFRRPTQALDSVVSSGRAALLSLENMTPIGGGVPIMVDIVLVGAIGVSGAMSTQDAEVARAGAAAVRP